MILPNKLDPTILQINEDILSLSPKGDTLSQYSHLYMMLMTALTLMI